MEPDYKALLEDAIAALGRIADILDGTFKPGDDSYAEEVHGIAVGWRDRLVAESRPS